MQEQSKLEKLTMKDNFMFGAGEISVYFPECMSGRKRVQTSGWFDYYVFKHPWEK